ncbi:MAG: polysaccharide biosynthesis tyrosine autokinase [Candidatus Nanopelagicales bacterium]|jgi:capsular exopolysaccharide synthesis family protein
MSLGGYLDVVRRRWLSIVVITLAVLGGTAVYTLTTTKTYTATAQSFVALTGEADSSSNALTGAQFAAQRVKSYTQIAGSPDVLQPVIAELKLPYTDSQLAMEVSASNPPLTVLIDVAVTDASAQQAAAIANAVSVQLGRTIEQLETPNAQTIAPVKVTLTEPAQPPSAPSSPKTRINLVLGLLLGLAAGVGWAFLRNSLDNTVKSVAELDELSSSPSLGSVIFDSNAKTQALSALEATAIQSEGYRTIRANLQYLNVDDPVRAFVVTSAAPGDGKTTVACNLAIALAQAGRKVCLVEADLRRPRVSEYLQLNAQTGLTEVLAGQVKLDEALQDWGRGMLQVLPPGAIPPNPSELLGSHQMAQVIVNLKRDFDVVILDTPPLLAVSDAAVLASQADGAVVVVRHGKSSKDAVRNAVASLDQINAKILGTVLNAVPAKRGGGYGYGYGYGYGDAKAPSVSKAPANQQGA